MPTDQAFFLNYLPFWIVNYGLALFAWTCVGRFAMSWFAPPDWQNYIYVFFCRATDWVIRPVRVITPLIISDRMTIMVTALWLFALRFIISLTMLQMGLAPSVSTMGQG